MVVWTFLGLPVLRASSRLGPPFIAVAARAGGGAGSHPRVIVDPAVDPYEPGAHLRVSGRGLTGPGALGGGAGRHAVSLAEGLSRRAPFDEAKATARRALEGARQAGEVAIVARANWLLGAIATELDPPAEAIEAYRGSCRDGPAARQRPRRRWSGSLS